MLYKSVIAVGDSFTRGDELADCPYHTMSPLTSRITFSQHTWPALIAKSLNIDYVSEAVGGRGNQWISFAASGNIKQDTLLIVNWTWFERFDYINTYDDTWLTTHPRHENKLDHYFYKNIDNDIWNLHRNLQQMHSTIQLLKQNNIKFIMTCLDPGYVTTLADIRPDSFINLSIHTTWVAAINELHKQVVPYILDFDGMTFLEWTKINGWKVGPNGHPLEDAHTAAAEYMLVNKHYI
jgi:hypothetical protein